MRVRYNKYGFFIVPLQGSWRRNVNDGGGLESKLKGNSE